MQWVVEPAHGTGRPVTYDRNAYRGRNVIERAFNGLKRWRGLATRYDKHATVYRGALVLAAALLYRTGAAHLQRIRARGEIFVPASSPYPNRHGEVLQIRTKPFSPRELMARVRSVLELTQLRPQDILRSGRQAHCASWFRLPAGGR